MKGGELYVPDYHASSCAPPCSSSFKLMALVLLPALCMRRVTRKRAHIFAYKRAVREPPNYIWREHPCVTRALRAVVASSLVSSHTPLCS